MEETETESQSEENKNRTYRWPIRELLVAPTRRGEREQSTRCGAHPHPAPREPHIPTGLERPFSLGSRRTTTAPVVCLTARPKSVVAPVHRFPPPCRLVESRRARRRAPHRTLDAATPRGRDRPTCHDALHPLAEPSPSHVTSPHRMGDKNFVAPYITCQKGKLAG